MQGTTLVGRCPCSVQLWSCQPHDYRDLFGQCWLFDLVMGMALLLELVVTRRAICREHHYLWVFQTLHIHYLVILTTILWGEYLDRGYLGSVELQSHITMWHNGWFSYMSHFTQSHLDATEDSFTVIHIRFSSSPFPLCFLQVLFLLRRLWTDSTAIENHYRRSK